MDIIITIFSLVVLLFCVMIHELAHGYVAYSLGDPTAKYAGRLTLNPLKHLDMFGSINLPVALFDVGAVLLCTSVLAGYSALHNAASRYLFALGRENIAPHVFGEYHKDFFSPSLLLP